MVKTVCITYKVILGKSKVLEGIFCQVEFMSVKEVLDFKLIFESMEEIKQALDSAEIEQLKRNLKLSYKERFEMLTRLYKIQQTMNKAAIVHKPFIAK